MKKILLVTLLVSFAIVVLSFYPTPENSIVSRDGRTQKAETLLDVLEKEKSKGEKSELDHIIAVVKDFEVKYSSIQDVDLRQKILDDFLMRLKALLRDKSNGNVSSLIIQLLDSGIDSHFDVPIEINLTGEVIKWPSVRTFLLYALGKIEPSRAKQYAKKILQSASSADEWAIALQILDSRRNSNRPDFYNTPLNELSESTKNEEQNSLFTEHIKTILSKDEWINNPTSGYILMYDYLALDNAYDEIPRLFQLLEQNSQVSSASIQALHYFATRNKNNTFSRIINIELKTQTQIKQRALMFAMADLGDNTQLSTVMSYLKKSSISETELSYFYDSFPMRYTTLKPTLRGGFFPGEFDHLRPGGMERAYLNLKHLNATTTDPVVKTNTARLMEMIHQ